MSCLQFMWKRFILPGVTSQKTVDVWQDESSHRVRGMKIWHATFKYWWHKVNLSLSSLAKHRMHTSWSPNLWCCTKSEILMVSRLLQELFVIIQCKMSTFCGSWTTHFTVSCPKLGVASINGLILMLIATKFSH